jgi:hypothetical protein
VLQGMYFETHPERVAAFEGFDVEGFLLEEGLMGGNYGLIGFDFFEDIINE